MRHSYRPLIGVCYYSDPLGDEPVGSDFDWTQEKNGQLFGEPAYWGRTVRREETTVEKGSPAPNPNQLNLFAPKARSSISDIMSVVDQANKSRRQRLIKELIENGSPTMHSAIKRGPYPPSDN